MNEKYRQKEKSVYIAWSRIGCDPDCKCTVIITQAYTVTSIIYNTGSN